MRNNTFMSNSGQMDWKLLVFIKLGRIPECQGKERHIFIPSRWPLRDKGKITLK